MGVEGSKGYSGVTVELSGGDRLQVAVSMLTQYLRYEYKAGNLTSIEFESMNQNLKAMITGFNGVDKVHMPL